MGSLVSPSAPSWKLSSLVPRFLDVAAWRLPELKAVVDVDGLRRLPRTKLMKTTTVINGHWVSFGVTRYHWVHTSFNPFLILAIRARSGDGARQSQMVVLANAFASSWMFKLFFPVMKVHNAHQFAQRDALPLLDTNIFVPTCIDAV